MLSGGILWDSIHENLEATHQMSQGDPRSVSIKNIVKIQLNTTNELILLHNGSVIHPMGFGPIFLLLSMLTGKMSDFFDNSASTPQVYVKHKHFKQGISKESDSPYKIWLYPPTALI